MLSSKVIFLLLLFVTSKIQANNFLTEYEYAMMLYIEPRGLSCIKCHGLTGRKTEVLRYFKHYASKRRKDKKKEVKINPIYKLSFKDFKKGVLSKKNRFMPTYKLSTVEIKSIHYYLQKVNGLIKKNKKLQPKL